MKPRLGGAQYEHWDSEPPCERNIMSRNILTDLERGDEDCILRFADGAAFRVSYLSIRCRCQCAKCKPRQENEQRQLELEEEVEATDGEAQGRTGRSLWNQVRLADWMLQRDTYLQSSEKRRRRVRKVSLNNQFRARRSQR